MDDAEYALLYTRGGGEAFDDFEALDALREREEQQQGAGAGQLVQLGASAGVDSSA